MRLLITLCECLLTRLKDERKSLRAGHYTSGAVNATPPAHNRQWTVRATAAAVYYASWRWFDATGTFTDDVARLAELAPPGVLNTHEQPGGGEEQPCVRRIEITLTLGAGAGSTGKQSGVGARASAGRGGFVAKVVGLDSLRTTACVWSDRRIDVVEGAMGSACHTPDDDEST